MLENKKIIKTWVLIQFVILTFLPSSVFAGAFACLKEYVDIQRGDSSVEIEISGEVVDALFTTETGTLRAVAGNAGLKAIPPEIGSRLARLRPGVPVLDIPWHQLTKDEKRQLLSYAARANGQDFYNQRTITGLKFKETISLTFKEPTRFMGKDYPAGTHNFLSSDIFSGTQIEFLGPSSIIQKANFEIHLRRADGAGENLISARALQKGLGVPAENVHQHVVAQVPWKALAYDPFYESFKIVEFYRRVELLTQVFRIEKFFPIVMNVEAQAGGLNMAVNRQVHLFSIGRYFTSIGLSLQKHLTEGNLDPLKIKKILKSDFFYEKSLSMKHSFIGVRIGETYDGPLLQWGLEFRDLSPHLDQKLLVQLLNTVQDKMITGNYTLSEKVLRSFFQERSASSVDMSKHIYPPQVSEWTYYLKNKLASEYNAPGLENILRDTTNNEAIRLIFHKWESDPLYLTYPEHIEPMLKAQKQAIQMLAQGTKDTEAVAWFVKKSALGYLLKKSILE